MAETIREAFHTYAINLQRATWDQHVEGFFEGEHFGVFGPKMVRGIAEDFLPDVALLLNESQMSTVFCKKYHRMYTVLLTRSSDSEKIVTRLYG